MENRRQAVLSAAEKLIRRTGRLDFTMATLAKTAGVSLATPYNLFSSKATILYALLNRSLDRVDDMVDIIDAEPDPILRVLRAAEAAALFFTANPGDPAFYRALLQFLLGVHDPVHRRAFMERSVQYWLRAAEGLQQARLLLPEFPREQFAVEMMVAYVGITNLWIHGEINDREYVSRAGYTALVHMSLIRGRARKQILNLLQEYQQRLPVHVSFQVTPGHRPAMPATVRQPALVRMHRVI